MKTGGHTEQAHKQVIKNYNFVKVKFVALEKISTQEKTYQYKSLEKEEELTTGGLQMRQIVQ